MWISNIFVQFVGNKSIYFYNSLHTLRLIWGWWIHESKRSCLGRMLKLLRFWETMLYITERINLLKPTGHVMHQPFNIQQLYALPTLYLCVLYLSENKQRLVPLTA